MKLARGKKTSGGSIGLGTVQRENGTETSGGPRIGGQKNFLLLPSSERKKEKMRQ